MKQKRKPAADRLQARIGRPRVLHLNETTLKTLEGLGRISCTHKEVAGVLRVSERTLDAFYAEHPIAKSTFEEAREQGKMSVRRKQLALALAGDKTMLIWLGKQLLDQKDRSELTGKDGRALFDLTTLSDKELEELAAIRQRLALPGGDRSRAN